MVQDLHLDWAEIKRKQALQLCFAGSFGTLRVALGFPGFSSLTIQPGLILDADCKSSLRFIESQIPERRPGEENERP